MFSSVQIYLQILLTPFSFPARNLPEARALRDAPKQAPWCFAELAAGDLNQTRKKREVHEQDPIFFIIILVLDNSNILIMIILAGFVYLF